MTTLYRRVKIESAEQAEALPVGTVAVFPGQPSGAVRVGYGLGWAEAGDDESTDHEYVVGWTALVPIEAEEETHIIQTRGQTAPEWRTRLVTPWEEA